MKKLIVANWKMNPKSQKDAAKLFDAVEKGVKIGQAARVIICPPFLWLGELKSKKLALGAQNCHWETSGAFTGEISAAMLADQGVEYVILGHSERRQYAGETNEMINHKMKVALKEGLKPIFCVGEKEGEEMGAVLEEQLTQGLAKISVKQLDEIIIAYEPVWAISTSGTGSICSSDNALSAALFIRRVLTKFYSRFLAEKVPILYGGSVDANNCAEYIKRVGMNGVLVGGASLDAEEFTKIVKQVG